MIDIFFIVLGCENLFSISETFLDLFLGQPDLSVGSVHIFLLPHHPYMDLHFHHKFSQKTILDAVPNMRMQLPIIAPSIWRICNKKSRNIPYMLKK